MHHAFQWTFSLIGLLNHMNLARQQLLMVLDMKASNRVKARVEQRIAAGLCLGQHEDGSECSSPARTRGLCNRCHYGWRMRRLRMPATDAAVYDAKLIRAGRLLSPGGIRQYRRKSVFSRLAKDAS